jgi:hypothetical protein
MLAWLTAHLKSAKKYTSVYDTTIAAPATAVKEACTDKSIVDIRK